MYFSPFDHIPRSASRASTSACRVIGYLDDDPEKIGDAINSPMVLGTTDQLMEIASQRGVKTAMLKVKRMGSNRKTLFMCY